MCKWSKLKKPILTALSVIGVAHAGVAQAQVAGNPDYYLKGSDTWFEVMIDAVAAAKADGTLRSASPALVYDGTGSGNAENAMIATTCEPGQTAPCLGTQSVGPMSRNFKATVITTHPTWAPSARNVAGLDGAVIARSSSSAFLANLDLPRVPPLNATNVTRANDPSVACSFGTLGSCYDQMLAVLYGGSQNDTVGADGSVAGCSSPRRVQAVADFIVLNGLDGIRHLYRRDDNSGTTDTIKEKLFIRRFCNGTAAGGNVARADGKLNLNNQDFDPIRQPCDISNAQRNQTTCTDLSTGLLCNSASAPCTQGLVVALSQGDPAIPDVTVSIGNRVGRDLSGTTFGYAGKEAVNIAVAPGTAPIFIDTVPPEPGLIISNTYMLSRRLYLQHGADILDNAQSTLRCPSTSATNFCAGGLTDQLGQETLLWNWMTDPNPSTGDPGRCHLDPILTLKGFIPCDPADCFWNGGGPENLCSLTPYDTAASSAATCVRGAVACTSGSICCSSGAACPTSGTCPADNARPVNSACSPVGVQDSCAAGLTCQDIFIGIPVCQ